MKKTILVTILVAVMLLAAIGSVNAASVTANKTTIKAGETVQITVKPSEARDGVQFDVSYNADELQYVGTEKPAGMEVMDEVANGTGRVMVYSMNGTTTEAVVMTFKALKDVESTEVKVTGFVSGAEEVEEAGKVTLKVEKVEDQKDPTNPEKPGNTEKPSKPTDINGKPITEHPQTGTPIYVVAVVTIIIAAGAILAVRKNK